MSKMKDNNEKKTDVIGIVLDIIVIIISIVIIYMLIDLLLGKTPEAIDIISSLVGLLIVNAFRVQYSLGNLGGKFEIFNQNVRDGFSRVKEGMEELKGNMNELKKTFEENTQEIKKEIRKLRK